MCKVPVYCCPRINTPFRVDGNLSKPIWQSAPVIDLKQAQDGKTPSQFTTVRGCWDGENLYLAFICQDKDIRATFQQRDDRVWQEEAIEAFIAPYGDLRHYYEFQCSPINTVRDVKVTNPNLRAEKLVFEGEWNCAGWQTAVSTHFTHEEPDAKPCGWCAEWRIPLQALLDPQAGPILPGEEWRINFYRIDRWPQEEFSSWSPTPGEPLSFHRPIYFGRWIFE